MKRRADCCEVEPGVPVYDDHPRHVIAVGAAGETEALYHMDCCAARGCEVCKLQTSRAYELAGEGAIGNDLRAALVELTPLVIEHESGDPLGAHAQVQEMMI